MLLFSASQSPGLLLSLAPKPFPKPYLGSVIEATQLFVPITLFPLQNKWLILSVISLLVCLGNGDGVLSDQLVVVIG